MHKFKVWRNIVCCNKRLRLLNSGPPFSTILLTNKYHHPSASERPHRASPVPLRLQPTKCFRVCKQIRVLIASCLGGCLLCCAVPGYVRMRGLSGGAGPAVKARLSSRALQFQEEMSPSDTFHWFPSLRLILPSLLCFAPLAHTFL